MEWTNREVSRLFNQIAAALTVKKADRFRIAAYSQAAAAIEHLSSESKDLWDDNKLDQIPGVGKKLAEHLNELFLTGRVKHFEKIKKNLPPAMFEFLNIPGIGPKTALKLCRELKIKSKKEAVLRLKQAIAKGLIKPIPGLDRKKVEDRMLLPYASALAQKIIDYLKKEKSLTEAHPLGSLRRKTATIGDIDLAASTNHPEKVIKRFLAYPLIKRVVASGQNTARVILRSSLQVDLKVQSPETYGSLLQHYTGSKQHNIHLREIAQKKNLSLSEHGIKKKSGGITHYANEVDFYKALGMKWIPPELREDRGEIEASLKGKLPKLVELREVKGDLHLHSSFDIETSHDQGLDSFKLMQDQAKALGYEYLGFSEHNPSISKHNSYQIINLIKRKKEAIDKLNYSSKNNVHILNGLEIDIRTDGSLAFPDQGFSLLDYAIVSIHSSFGLNRKTMTLRILKALSHPKAKILGHPTGRILGKRESYELDWDNIFSFCLKNDKWVEISAWPNRLDLPDSLVFEAVKKGVKIVINSDSHSLEDMNLMKYGVSVARRGWAKKNDVINTLPLKLLNDRL